MTSAQLTRALFADTDFADVPLCLRHCRKLRATPTASGHHALLGARLVPNSGDDLCRDDASVDETSRRLRSATALGMSSAGPTGIELLSRAAAGPRVG